jgi:chromosome partitioning protein
MKIVTVTGYKGGVAKSTTSVHIATYFSDKGKTILVDSDPNRTALAWSQRGNLPFTVADERQAMKMIAGNDFVVIDTPARPDSSDLKELAKGCDLLVLPTIPDVVSLEPMLKTASDLGDANYRALLAIVPPSPSKEGVAMRQELIDNGIPVFKSMIRRSAGFQKAALEGVPIRDVSDTRSRVAWLDYQALGKEIMEVLGDG